MQSNAMDVRSTKPIKADEAAPVFAANGLELKPWPEKEMEGWLCPALLRYFPQPPARLFVQLKAARAEGNLPLTPRPKVS